MNQKNKRYTLLIFLIFCILALGYNIIAFGIRKYSDDVYRQDMTIRNQELEMFNQESIRYLTMIQSEAYKDKFNKMTQNKKNPFEEVIVILDERTKEKYTRMEISDTLRIPLSSFYNSTRSLSIPQKWKYYIFKKHEFHGF